MNLYPHLGQGCRVPLALVLSGSYRSAFPLTLFVCRVDLTPQNCTPITIITKALATTNTYTSQRRSSTRFLIKIRWISFLRSASLCRQVLLGHVLVPMIDSIQHTANSSEN